MGDAGDLRQGESVYRPIVAFDFDGTLTVHDSFRSFLRWRVGLVRYLAGWATLAPALARYVRDRDRGRLKAAAIGRFLGGTPRAELEDAARKFAEGHARRMLRPDALRAWARWRERGARLVIVSASPEEIVQPFARGLGADVLIATRLAYDDKDRLTGRLDGENCRGAEKVRRLKAEFGPDMRLEAAYGDSDGDREMLAMAEERGLKVFQGTP
ncbi:MAG TPA: HAD-IB family hydrolase [Caulobacteraceae bacterium]|jgi:phosphatidylglycerophosphatase C|nr:HAD-IB family hydrolase [Caulobacteraceae bacterium]